MNKTTSRSRLLVWAAAIVVSVLLVGLWVRGPAAAPAPPPATAAATRPPAPPTGAGATASPVAPRVAATLTPTALAPSATAVRGSATPLAPTATAVRGPATALASATLGLLIPHPTAAPTPTSLPVETPLPGAWLSRRTAHYDLYYLPGSPAARDADQLARLAEDALGVAAANLQASPNVRIRIYFVNRIFWQGGASYSHNELLISYPGADRDYTSTSLVQVLRHETTHALVEQMQGTDAHKGGLLGEGTAVWSAGGHYQPEALATLSSTLIAENADLYLPLADLSRDFYGAQHEIAYLEGGAYVQFLVNRWGLARFKRYLAQPLAPQPIYGLDAAQLEAAWRTWLAATPHTGADSTAVRLRVRYYDLMRRYETTLDADARILPDRPPSQWGPTLIGLFMHPATAPANLTLEHAFVQAGNALWSRDLPTCARLLDDLARHIPADGMP